MELTVATWGTTADAGLAREAPIMIMHTAQIAVIPVSLIDRHECRMS